MYKESSVETKNACAIYAIANVTDSPVDEILALAKKKYAFKHKGLKLTTIMLILYELGYTFEEVTKPSHREIVTVWSKAKRCRIRKFRYATSNEIKRDKSLEDGAKIFVGNSHVFSCKDGRWVDTCDRKRFQVRGYFEVKKK